LRLAVTYLQFPVQVLFLATVLQLVSNFPQFTFTFQSTNCIHNQEGTFPTVIANVDLWHWPSNLTYIASRWIIKPNDYVKGHLVWKLLSRHTHWHTYRPDWQLYPNSSHGQLVTPKNRVTSWPYCF